MYNSIAKMLRSFRYAARGVAYAMYQENNFRYHMLATLGALVVGWATKFTVTEWCLVLMLIGMVYAAEIVNTAIEKLMDKLHPGQDPDVGRVKDLAAGAVLVASITAAVVGSIIVFGKLFDL